MSELAQQLIEEEKRQRTGYLDLGNCGLNEIPDLSGLDWLDTLMLASSWWDWERREWIHSQNEGFRNRITQFETARFSKSLRNIILHGLEISDASFLGKLPNLTELNLVDNQISDVSFLGQLTRLTKLNLASNQISDCSFLSHLTKLTTLDLSFNQISDCSSLSHLTKLTELRLSSNQISDGSFLSHLTKLTELHLGINQIIDGSFLSHLTKLTKLDLFDNQISDCSSLSHLTKLTTLELSFNQISDCSSLSHLTKLSELGLSSNQIIDCSSLSHLTKLTELSLNRNQVIDGSFLMHLTKLTELRLSSNQISDASFLGKLPNLTELNLSFNQISDGSFLSHLTKLTELNFRYNQISDVSFLGQLTDLTELNLANNQISDCSFLSHLTKLTTLDLSFNQISDCSSLSHLTKLTELSLSSIQISDWSFLSHLTKLINLNLSNNQISDGSFLSHLTKLTTLNLGSNRINDWSFMVHFTNLTALYLVNNQISDVSFLGQLTRLTKLNLASNQISDCSFLSHLTKLTTLNLNDNQISDVSFLGQLTELTKIDLSKNEIRYFEPMLALVEKRGFKIVGNKKYESNKRESNKREINIDDNPLENPGIEVIQQGSAAILDYFKQKKKGQKLLLEAKLVLLGDGRAGKTSLANRLLGKPLPTEHDRTKGVDIVIGEYGFDVEGQDFKLHIWDFAGQDKYKPLHQFFYTEGAVYVMVADSGNAQTDFDDWFQTAGLFGAGSPLVIVLNEFSETMGKSTFDEDHWRKQFPSLIKEVHLVNLQSQKGVPELERSLCYFAENLPHTKTVYPQNWANIRSELERRRDENYISVKGYFSLCEKNDLIGEESAFILSGILHKIGVCLHYQHNPLLEQFVILKNEWATQAVYKILEDETISEQKKGFFDWSDLERIWSDTAYKYMHPQLLELMQQFKMAYVLPNRKEFVTPPLLPPAPPDDWEFSDGEPLELFVEYEFLPKALLTQFIVTRHRDIDRGRTLVWRNGVVLRWSDDTFSEVVKTKSKGRDAFSIRAMGSNRRGLLTSILKSLRDLHQEYKGIRFAEIVACPCAGCRSGKNKQHFFDFENLKNRLEKGRRVVECDRSLEELDLMKLIGDLLVVEQLEIGQPVVLKDVKKEKHEPLTIRVFLASSAELADERNKLRLFFSEKNDRYVDSGIPIYLKLENWEAMSGIMSETRKQDDYNKRILESDLFICLAHTKVGKYTEEEFDLAWATFQKTAKPKILTFFKTQGVDPLSVQSSLHDFNKKLLGTLDHFHVPYDSYADLERKIWKELEMFLG